MTNATAASSSAAPSALATSRGASGPASSSSANAAAITASISPTSRDRAAATAGISSASRRCTRMSGSIQPDSVWSHARTVGITGPPSASERLPIFALVVVGLSLLMLAVTFRSLKLAVLSAVFNLVSIAAAYGIVHLLFQKEGGADLIGVEVQPIIAYTPLFMFAILFGLSTDYNVFLLSRVREEWERLGRVKPAVAIATARTKRTITAAGAIMIVVFLGFATDPDPTIKMTGVGLATAILVDITLVRLLLAPAALTLIGDRLWGQRAPSTASARSRSPASRFHGEKTIATEAENAR